VFSRAAFDTLIDKVDDCNADSEINWKVGVKSTPSASQLCTQPQSVMEPVLQDAVPSAMNLYCFSYTEDTGTTKKTEELETLQYQYSNGLSIFACEQQDVFADVAVEVGPGLTTIKVDDVETKQMRTMRDAVVTFNAQAFSARACVVKCSGDIATTTRLLEQAEEEALRFKQDCEDEIRKLETERVMDNVLLAIKCNDPVLLFQCKHCDKAVMLNHSPVQLAKLQSGVARSSVQKALTASSIADGTAPWDFEEHECAKAVRGAQRILFSCTFFVFYQFKLAFRPSPM